MELDPNTTEPVLAKNETAPCSLSTRAVMQHQTAHNEEKTLIQKLITLLNKQQSALENDIVAHLFGNNRHLHRAVKSWRTNIY